MSDSNIGRLKAAGVLKDEHADQFGDAEKAHVDNMCQEDVEHLIRIKNNMRASDSDAAPIACFF